jgi:FKBP-type peptidyl-prolyl cis-trans isomerase 2
MLDETIKLPRMKLVRDVAGAVVGSFDGGIVVVDANTPLGQDLALNAEQVEPTTDTGEFIVGLATINIHKGTTTEEAVMTEEPPITTPGEVGAPE